MDDTDQRSSSMPSKTYSAVESAMSRPSSPAALSSSPRASVQLSSKESPRSSPTCSPSSWLRVSLIFCATNWYTFFSSFITISERIITTTPSAICLSRSEEACFSSGVVGTRLVSAWAASTVYATANWLLALRRRMSLKRVYWKQKGSFWSCSLPLKARKTGVPFTLNSKEMVSLFLVIFQPMAFFWVTEATMGLPPFMAMPKNTPCLNCRQPKGGGKSAIYQFIIAKWKQYSQIWTLLGKGVILLRFGREKLCTNLITLRVDHANNVSTDFQRAYDGLMFYIIIMISQSSHQNQGGGIRL